jgi:hypothetical protein
MASPALLQELVLKISSAQAHPDRPFLVTFVSAKLENAAFPQSHRERWRELARDGEISAG